MQPGPADVPAPCARCGSVQLHRPGADGAMHCLRCLSEPAASPPAAGAPPMIDVRPRAMPLGDQVLRAIVIVVLLLVIVGVYGHACNAH